MNVINQAFTEAVNTVKGTFGDVTAELQGGAKEITDAFGDSLGTMRATAKSLGARMTACLSTLYDEHPVLIIGAGAIVVVSSPIWGPIVGRMAARVPKAVWHVAKTPLVLLGLVRH